MNKFTLIGLCCILYACTNQNASDEIDTEEFKPIPFFDFTKVDHYSIKISEDEIWGMEEIDSGQVNYEFNRILVTPFPDSISDTLFISSLEQFGYSKKEIPQSKNEALNELFSEKKHKDFYQYMCLPEYRDILIFKDSFSVTGIAKICFSCDQAHILGANANTQYFGMSGDYARLGELLYKEKETSP